MSEILGPDFDPTAGEVELMTIGELNIQLNEDFTLGNIAIRDNFLILQVREPDSPAVPAKRWSLLTLIDSRIEPVNWEVWEAAWNELLETGTEEEQFEFIMELSALGSGRYLNDLYNIDVTPTDADFMQIGNMRYLERVFHIPLLEDLEYLNFFVTGRYFNIISPVNINVSVTAPIIGGKLTAVNEDAYAAVTIEDSNFTFRNFTITTMNIDFDVDEAQAMIELMNDFDRIFVPTNYFDIYLLYVDGTEVRYDGFTTGWSWTEGAVSIYGAESTEPAEVSMTIGGGIIDVDNLSAIRINGTRIDVRPRGRT